MPLSKALNHNKMVNYCLSLLESAVTNVQFPILHEGVCWGGSKCGDIGGWMNEGKASVRIISTESTLWKDQGHQTPETERGSSGREWDEMTANNVMPEIFSESLGFFLFHTCKGDSLISVCGINSEFGFHFLKNAVWNVCFSY